MMVLLPALTHASVVQRRPFHRDTKLDRAGAPAAVILVPDLPEYRKLGQELASAIGERTHVQLDVKNAAEYVTDRPRAAKPELLTHHFILLGQFWNNAVLERLYANFFDPTDALFPGPGGFELRTVCSPFREGQNCVVATGSDLEGCRKAVTELPGLLKLSEAGGYIPFLHRVHLTGEAEAVETGYRQRVAPFIAELDRYAVFGHPQAKTWSGEDPRDFLVWKDRNLAVAACFGLRFWATGDKQDVEVFKRLVLGCAEHVEDLRQAYQEGRVDLIEYSLCGLTIAWDLIEETDAFSEFERQQITDYLFQLAYLNRNAYFLYKCKDLPLDQVAFYNRHQIAGTFWMGMAAEYFTRNCALTGEQQQLAEEWRSHARRYLERLSQSYFYSDGTELLHDEGGMVMRYALMTGLLDFVDNGSLRLLADYWVANHDNLGFMSSSGHCGATRHGPVAGEVLNVAGWLFPGEGYQWFRRRVGRWPYTPFLFYMNFWTGSGLPYFNYELPPTEDGAEKLKARMTGIYALPLGQAFDALLRRQPDAWTGGYQRVPNRYHYDSAPYDETYKRIVLRSGFEPSDQYLVLDGMQGLEWSYDDLNAIVRYCDLGQPLLKSQWEARNVESRLEMNTLLTSRGAPGARQSVAARLLTASDLGPEALLSTSAAEHDGVTWTRNVFWRKGSWFLLADEVLPHTDGDHFVAQTWLSWNPFQEGKGDTVAHQEATMQTNGVTLHLAGTPERQFDLAEGGEGLRQKVIARLRQHEPFLLWNLLYAEGTSRNSTWKLHRVSPGAVLLTGSDGLKQSAPSTLAFLGKLEMAGLRIDADMGLLSPDRLTVAGCRELRLGHRKLASFPQKTTFSWNLATNAFESGKSGFGLRPGASPAGLQKQRNRVIGAIQKSLKLAAALPSYSPPETRQAEATPLPSLTIEKRLQLTPPVSLAAADLDGDGNEELLLYDSEGSPRFTNLRFYGTPIAVDLEGKGQRDIALALDKALALYHPDGTLRWKQDLTNTAAALSVGDLDGDGREELGLSLHNWAAVFDHAGKRVLDEEVYRYNGIGGAFGDVDGDGKAEFVAVTCSGVNVLKPGQPRQTLGFQSYFGMSPCRVWLRDLDGDGTPECYVGGGGTDPACYDLRKMELRWKFDGAAIHPRDAVLYDVDGDGKAEIVSGGGDGFLYVVGSDGAFRFSRSVGGAVTALAVVPSVTGTSERLAVGLETGKLLLFGKDLRPVGEARVGDQPVRHLAVLRRVGRGPVIIAADDNGKAVRIEP